MSERRTRWVWAAGAAAVVMLVGAGLLAGSESARALSRWGHGHHHDPEAMKEHMAWGLERALRRLDASDDQQSRAQEIAERTFDALAPLVAEHREHRDEMLALLGAETIDRDALEALRAEELELLDRASRSLLSGLSDLAETLTPEQRAEILERGHHRWHRHGWRRRG